MRSAPAVRRDHVEGLLVLVHVPKTAGTTLATILHHHYGEAFDGGVGVSRRAPAQHRAPNVFSRPEALDGRLRAIAANPALRAMAAHITYGLHDRLPADARYITILREPVERTLSQYYFLVRPPDGRVGRTGGGFVPPWLPPPSPELTLDECLTEGGYIPDNLQTRMLCGLVSPHDPLPSQALSQAKRNLSERFAFVGTTERFEEFLALLNVELGWPTVAYKRAHANPGRLRSDDVPADMLRIAEERNALDRELYAHAAKLLEEALERGGPELELELEVLRGAERLRRARLRGEADAAAAVRSLPLDARVELALKEAELAGARLRAKKTSSKLKWQAAEPKSGGRPVASGE
jgi:hypothetical protein